MATLYLQATSSVVLALPTTTIQNTPSIGFVGTDSVTRYVPLVKSWEYRKIGAAEYTYNTARTKTFKVKCNDSVERFVANQVDLVTASSNTGVTVGSRSIYSTTSTSTLRRMWYRYTLTYNTVARYSGSPILGIGFRFNSAYWNTSSNAFNTKLPLVSGKEINTGATYPLARSVTYSCKTSVTSTSALSFNTSWYVRQYYNSSSDYNTVGSYTYTGSAIGYGTSTISSE